MVGRAVVQQEQVSCLTSTLSMTKTTVRQRWWGRTGYRDSCEVHRSNVRGWGAREIRIIQRFRKTVRNSVWPLLNTVSVWWKLEETECVIFPFLVPVQGQMMAQEWELKNHKSQSGEATKPEVQLWTLIQPVKSEPWSPAVHGWGVVLGLTQPQGRSVTSDEALWQVVWVLLLVVWLLFFSFSTKMEGTLGFHRISAGLDHALWSWARDTAVWGHTCHTAPVLKAPSCSHLQLWQQALSPSNWVISPWRGSLLLLSLWTP